MSDEQGEIVDTGTEKEILYGRITDHLARILPLSLNPDRTIRDDADLIADMAVLAVLGRLRVLSARQLAVLLAEDANRHEGWVIREPARYTQDEIDGEDERP